MAKIEDKTIREYLERFYQSIDMPGGYQFSHVDTLKQIDNYWNSHFMDGDTDGRGRLKPFYNIVKPAVNVARKFVDLDTKNFTLVHEMTEQYWDVWLMTHDFRTWMKETKWANTINEVVDDYPKYGHVFMKKSGDNKWRKLNIQNLRFEPSSQNFSTDVWFMELQEMSKSEIKGMKWNGQDLQTVLNSPEKKFIVYAVLEKNDEGTWNRSFRTELFTKTVNGQQVRSSESQLSKGNDYNPSLILHEDVVADINDLYREVKWEDVPGRRLGCGYVEELFMNQMAENEAEYLERLALHFKALQVWITADSTFKGRNLLSDMESGDVLESTKQFNVLPKDNADVIAFNATRGRWAQNTKDKTFTADVTRGENLPSGTPLGVANMSVAMIVSFYEKKQQKLGLFFKDIVLDEVLPSFKTAAKKSHEVLISNAEGVEKFIEFYAEKLVDRKAFEYAMGRGNGFFPSEDVRKQEVQKIIQSLKGKRGQGIIVPDNTYQDVATKLDLVITGEQLDVAAVTKDLMTIFQALASNPAVMQNRGLRTILTKIMEYRGVSAVDMNLVNEGMEESPVPTSVGPTQAAQNPNMPMGGQMGKPMQTV